MDLASLVATNLRAENRLTWEEPAQPEPAPQRPEPLDLRRLLRAMLAWRRVA